ncbi:hypothetical protein D1006_15705 [Burkholderia stabilis]|uniref:Uncharacterized protein n=1 Tax=Burkholderia stabilis TaxID=95485 RepID=A0A4Q2AVI2_9BURK|nr:hypothetical protein D1006_15705 [Burkholderia stabilis]
MKPAPAKADGGFVRSFQNAPADGPQQPNDRLIRSPGQPESIVPQRAGSPRPRARCLVTPL